MSFEEQRVLMGIDDWDRAESVDEARAHRSKTANYIGQAMEVLQRAKRAGGHRRLKKSNKGLHKRIANAYEALRRAQEACYAHGETYDIEEGEMGVFSEDERNALESLCEGVDLKMEVPAYAHSSMDKIYQEWVRFERLLKKGARKDPSLKRALKATEEAMGALVTAKAKWKEAEASLYSGLPRR